MASSMGWRIFSTNTVSDLGDSQTQAPARPPHLSRIKRLDRNLFCLRGRPAAVGSRALLRTPVAHLRLPGESQGGTRASAAGVGGPLDTWSLALCDTPLPLVPHLQVFNGSREMPYTNPRGPVHIITGSAVSSMGKGAFGFLPLDFYCLLYLPGGPGVYTAAVANSHPESLGSPSLRPIVQMWKQRLRQSNTRLVADSTSGRVWGPCPGLPDGSKDRGLLIIIIATELQTPFPLHQTPR